MNQEATGIKELYFRSESDATDSMHWWRKCGYTVVKRKADNGFDFGWDVLCYPTPEHYLLHPAK